MKIGIIYNKFIENKTLLNSEIRAALAGFSDYKIMDSENIKTGCDFAFAIGGDGTIIKVAKFFADTNIPVMGINLGRLGFLAQDGMKNLREITSSVLKKEFQTEARTLLECNSNLALNDFVIKGSEYARTTKFVLEINNKPTCEYVADGLIISTPTGSTAYCLSAGGPIIEPSVPAFVIVPICPHTLTARPLVIPNSETISVSIAENEAPLTLAADGHDLGIFTDSVEIKKSDKQAILAFLNDNRFYNVLSKKFYWGISPCKKEC